MKGERNEENGRKGKGEKKREGEQEREKRKKSVRGREREGWEKEGERLGKWICKQNSSQDTVNLCSFRSHLLQCLFTYLEILTALLCSAPVSYPFKMSKHTKALHCMGIKVKHKVFISHQDKGFFLLQIQDVILRPELLLYNLPEILESFWLAQYKSLQGRKSVWIFIMYLYC